MLFIFKKKSNIEPNNKKDLDQFSPYLTFSLDEENRSDILEEKKSKKEQFHKKHIKCWCQDCNKFIYKDCWSLYH